MLGFEHFEHNLIYKYTALMGSIIANISIERQDQDGNSLSLIQVPTALATKERMIARLQADPSIDRPFSVLLPRLSWEHTGMRYDGSRKLNTINRRVEKIGDNPNKFRYVWNPVPYDLFFKVVVYAKNQQDLFKIVEQILPFFTPDWTATVQLLDQPDITHDIPTVLDMASIEDLYNEDFTQRRVLTWDLEFTMKGYLYGPVINKPIIKFANTALFLFGSNSAMSSILTQPGLTANGQPTSNLAQSVSALTIKVDDDWGYIQTLTDNVQ